MFEKNYRLQDIQLSKICLRPAGFGETSSRLTSLAWLFRYAALTGLPSHSQDDSALFESHVRPAKAGGEYRARTGDLLVANQALSQLS